MITEATIYVSNFEETKQFYKELFEEALKDSENDRFTLELPLNSLHLVENQTDEKPYYHFAFLIPFALFDQAKAIVQEKVTLNEEDGKDEISFKPGIRSIYFYDPSGNIVEFIAVDKADSGLNFTSEYSAKEIQALVEMSLVSTNISETAEQLKKVGIFGGEPTNVKQDGLTFIRSKITTLLLSPTNYRWIFSHKDAKVFPQTIVMDDKTIHVDEIKTITVK